jgi:hypothetical protein
MTDTLKLEEQNPENNSKATGELTDGELNQVSGGWPGASAPVGVVDKVSGGGSLLGGSAVAFNIGGNNTNQ